MTGTIGRKVFLVHGVSVQELAGHGQGRFRVDIHTAAGGQICDMTGTTPAGAVDEDVLDRDAQVFFINQFGKLVDEFGFEKPVIVSFVVLFRGRQVDFLRYTVDHANTAGDACIDNQPAAHDAGSGIGIGLIGLKACDINRSANHVPAGGRNNRVGFGVNGYTEFVAFPFGYVHLFPLTELTVDAVRFAAGSAVVAGGYDFIMIDDDGAIAAPKAGAASGNLFGNVEIILVFADAFHDFILVSFMS